jgi:hypothetical protein
MVMTAMVTTVMHRRIGRNDRTGEHNEGNNSEQNITDLHDQNSLEPALLTCGLPGSSAAYLYEPYCQIKVFLNRH